MGIGIDVGGTAIKAGVVDERGYVKHRMHIATNLESDYEQILSNLEEIIVQLCKNSAESSVGIGVPGIVSANGEMVLSCPNLGWKNKALKKDLETRLDLKVNLVNDANAAAMGESLYGSGKGKTSSILLTLGTGIGGGLIINNGLIAGSHGVGSEIGHIIVGENFYQCGCGKNGCLETFSSATALTKYVNMRIKEGATSELKECQELDAEVIFDAAKKNDILACEATERMFYYLGLVISNLIDIIDPEIFIIGGGLSAAGDFLLKGIREATYKFLTYKELVRPEIVLASLGNDAGLIGAASL
ncbi:ROK family glucokinase [Eubacteriaceae bacterium ES3]|nr:ROK family glucokinase [Eubacteriaceae bacterium ES3]